MAEGRGIVVWAGGLWFACGVLLPTNLFHYYYSRLYYGTAQYYNAGVMPCISFRLRACDGKIRATNVRVGGIGARRYRTSG